MRGNLDIYNTTPFTIVSIIGAVILFSILFYLLNVVKNNKRKKIKEHLHRYFLGYAFILMFIGITVFSGSGLSYYYLLVEGSPKEVLGEKYEQTNTEKVHIEESLMDEYEGRIIEIEDANKSGTYEIAEYKLKEDYSTNKYVNKVSRLLIYK